MIYKQINLCLSAILIIILVFQIPVYNKWLTTKVLSGVSLSYQLDHLNFDARMSYRFGVPYSVYRAVQKTLENSKAVNPVVLLPPNGYLKAMKPENDFNIIEPPIFYYFTGIRAVTLTSPDVKRADWVMIIENHKVGLRRLPDKATFDETVAELNKYN